MPFEKRKAEVGQRKTFPGYVSNERAVVCKGDHFFLHTTIFPWTTYAKDMGKWVPYISARFIHVCREISGFSLYAQSPHDERRLYVVLITLTHNSMNMVVCSTWIRPTMTRHCNNPGQISLASRNVSLSFNHSIAEPKILRCQIFFIGILWKLCRYENTYKME